MADADRRVLVDEVEHLRRGIVTAINLIRGWCAPGGPGLFSPVEACELMLTIRKAMGDQLIDALSAASRPADGTDLAEGDALMEAATADAKSTEARSEATAYLVLGDDGRTFISTLDSARASEAAHNIGGVVVALPVVEDHREQSGGTHD